MNTIIFDLGTLAVSKDPLDGEMVSLIEKLLKNNNVAIISKSSWKHVSKQIEDLSAIDQKALNNLYIIPSSGGSLYQAWPKYGWVAVYQNKLGTKEIEKITSSIEEAIIESGFQQPQKLWGKQIEPCESNIIFAALGHKAPSEDEDKWDVDCSKRRVLIEALRRKLTSYDVRPCGMSSIDISMKGINKKYGIDELMKKIRASKDDLVYIGNAIYKGGSDYAAIEMGLVYSQVKDPEDTKNWIRGVLDSGYASKMQAM